MPRIRKLATGLLICALAVAGGYFGNELFQDHQFARAADEVKQVRDELHQNNNGGNGVQNFTDLSSAFRNVGKVVSPSVVNINVRKTLKNVLPDDQLHQFFNAPNGDNGPDLEEIGTGSGVIMDVAGGKAFILTNNHVAGGADNMVITLADGRVIKNGKVLGADPKTDLAVVQVDADKLIPAQWGNSEELQRGDWVMAFGSPFGYVGSMTHGIVSSLHRQADLLGPNGYENFIQVDAPINPGNSGGPLTNLKGEVVGINTAIASRSGGFQGIGFAIPSNQAKAIYNALKEKGKVIRGWLGIGIADIAKQADEAKALGFKGEDGVLVREMFPNTPASNKLQVGDVITSIDGKAVGNVQELRGTVALTTPGTEIKLGVFRDGKNVDVPVKLGEQPDDLSKLATITPQRGDKNQGQAFKDQGFSAASVTPELTTRFNLTEKTGAVVTSVDRSSLAATAGLQPGDVITRVGDKAIASADELAAALKDQDIHKGIRMDVSSNDGKKLLFLQSDK